MTSEEMRRLATLMLFVASAAMAQMPLNLPMSQARLDREAIMTVPQIIEHWGYKAETHNVVTEDGYVITMHRIPHGRNERSNRSSARRPVVFLMHGLLCTSSVWVLNRPDQSAGFVFADASMDVWLGNVRGNSYGRHHLQYNETQPEFWAFSFDEIARFDLEAQIDYVLEYTEEESLYYVGHSQGTLTMFAKQAMDQPFAQKIRAFFALAPVGTMAHVRGMFATLGQMYDQMKMMYLMTGDGPFLSANVVTRAITDMLCDERKTTTRHCRNLIFAVSGPDSHQLNNSRIGIYLAHNPDGTSSRNILHYAQMVKTHQLTMFDHGNSANLRFYRRTRPPPYDVKDVLSPLYLFYSDADWLATAADVESFLLKRLNARIVGGVFKLDDFNHNDFLWGLRAREEIYDRIVDIVSRDMRRRNTDEGSINRASYFRKRQQQKERLEQRAAARQRQFEAWGKMADTIAASATLPPLLSPGSSSSGSQNNLLPNGMMALPSNAQLPQIDPAVMGSLLRNFLPVGLV